MPFTVKLPRAYSAFPRSVSEAEQTIKQLQATDISDTSKPGYVAVIRELANGKLENIIKRDDRTLEIYAKTPNGTAAERLRQTGAQLILG